MIKLEKINKVYDDGFQALKEIDLTFEDGKINVLIGPSGCGKTTTMKMLNRLTEHSDGKILIDGKDINEINPIELRRQMGYVIQSIGLFPHMTIYDNVATVPKLLKWDKKRIKKRVIELLEMVNLDPKTYMKRYPSELSGGQQQRIGVIRALAAEPSTILMDEPFSALDPISREQLQDELVRLQRDIKKTIIFVTHDMDEAIKIADQIILMKDGYVVQKGSPQEILSNPKNDFVREFIGTERLENVKTLPEVSEFTQKDYPFITIDSSIEEATNLMINNNISELPVVEENQNYIGVLSLYQALSTKEVKVDQVVNKSVDAVVESTNATSVIKTSGALIPIVTEQGKLVGVLNSEKLLETIHQNYESKSGVA